MHATLYLQILIHLLILPLLQELALLNQVEELGNAIDIIQEEGLKYIAGYVISRFSNKYNYLGTSTEMIVIHKTTGLTTFQKEDKSFF